MFFKIKKQNFEVPNVTGLHIFFALLLPFLDQFFYFWPTVLSISLFLLKVQAPHSEQENNVKSLSSNKSTLVYGL